MSSDGPEFDDPRCPGCGNLDDCTCPTLAPEFIPIYETLAKRDAKQAFNG